MKTILFFIRNTALTLKSFCVAGLSLLLFGTNAFGQSGAAKGSPANSFMMCEVIPGPELASKAPYTIPLKSIEPWPTATIKTGCRYIFKSDDDQAFVTIGLTDLGSRANALKSYQNGYNASKDMWEETPAPVIILQDTGFFSGKDECGIKLALGKYILDINFKGQFDTVTAEQKKAAGIAIAEMVIDRLKYLWTRKER